LQKLAGNCNLFFMNKQTKIIGISILLSILFHGFLLWMIGHEQWLEFKRPLKIESPPEELAFTFPENKPRPVPNKPREVVQNKNFNNRVPAQSSLLSDKNSQARNPLPTKNKGNMPYSSGNSPLANLSPANTRIQNFRQKKFSKKALVGISSQASRSPSLFDRQKSSPSAVRSEGSNNRMDQKKFSVEEVGALTLSTYQWEWAPYINSMKNKLSRVWFAPPAYYQLGIIHGYTIIQYTIDRKGKLVSYRVLKHVGHESLEKSSTQAIESLFPFIPLPDDFPEKTLTITAKLMYPDPRNGR